MPEVLVEFTASNPLLGFSYLANVLAQESQSNIRSFVASPRASRVPRPLLSLLLRAGFFLGLISEARIYKSFGAVSGLLIPKTMADRTLDADKISEQFFLRDPNKRDLETFTVEDILLGDLIYDTYLRQQGVPTVNLADVGFRQFFRTSVKDFLFWLDYVSVERVAAVIASHAVYNLAFPLRVGLARGIPCYVAHSEAMYRLSEERPYTHCEFLDYPEFFDSLGQSQKEEIMLAAEKELEKRFKGLVGEDSGISEISAQSYRVKVSKQAFARTSKKKIVVALHAFSDSPHWGGHALFPDYWEWAAYLANWSKKSPHDWYLKAHPDGIHHADWPTVRELVTKFPHLNLLEGSVSHHQLIQEGVSVVLTVHGTIGLEYPLLGIPVVNASRTNPHIRYSFNHNPQTIGELEALLANLHNIQKPRKRDREQAIQYFAVKNYFSKKKLLIENLPDVRLPPGPYRARAHRNALTENFVKYFLQETHENHVLKIKAFVKSGQYFLK